MPHGRPSTGREEYAYVKLKKDTHLLWTERKRTLHLKSDNELALYLLDLTCAHGDTQRQLEQSPEAQSSQFVNDGILEDSEVTNSLHLPPMDLDLLLLGKYSL